MHFTDFQLNSFCIEGMRKGEKNSMEIQMEKGVPMIRRTNQ